MHGRLRTETSDPSGLLLEKAKAEKFKETMKNIFSLAGQDESTDQVLQLTARVLNVFSDVVTLWEIRRNILLKMRESAELSVRVETELNLIERCLTTNAKCYCVWHHRLWLVQFAPEIVSLSEELRLCKQLLDLDGRNFHCWNYRRRIVEWMKVPLEEELDFTLELINYNFSNYSSWHYRSTLFAPRRDNPDEELLDTEFQLIENAIYTDPFDESAWIYYRWLMSGTTLSHEPRVMALTVEQTRDELVFLLDRHVEIRELDEALLISVIFSDGTKSSVDVLDLHTLPPNSIYGDLWIAKISVKLSHRDLTNVSIFFAESTLTVDLSAGETVRADDWHPWDRKIPWCPIRLKHAKSCQLNSLRQLHSLEPDCSNVIFHLAWILSGISSWDNQAEINTLNKSMSSPNYERYLKLADKFSAECIACSQVDGKVVGENVLLRELPADSSAFLFFADIRELSLVDVGLTSLRRFNILRVLRILDVSHNYITECEGLEDSVCLVKLKLDYNPIECVSGLDALSGCVNLDSLSVKSCPLVGHELDQLNFRFNIYF